MIEQLICISLVLLWYNRLNSNIILIIYLYIWLILWFRIWLSIELNNLIKDNTRLDLENEVYIIFTIIVGIIFLMNITSYRPFSHKNSKYSRVESLSGNYNLYFYIFSIYMFILLILSNNLIVWYLCLESISILTNIILFSN